MAGTFLGKYDTTSANNTATGTNSVSVAEGMLPSNINNAFRSVMADIRQHYNEAEWIEYGDGAGTYTATYASATRFTIDGANVTAIYHAGRRVKVVASTPGTIYGTISSTSFSTNTTVNVTWDSGNLSSEAITSVHIGALAKTNNSIPTEVIATGNIADSAVTTAKLASNAITTVKITDGNVTLAKLASDSVNGTKIADDAIDSEHYTNGSIDTAHIAADQIVGSLIADNAIDSEHYTDGSIDTAHIAADQITNAKIADDQIDSEHYVDGSIDTAHIADSQITSAKIVDGAILNADINASAAIDATKIANGTVTSAEFQYINTLSSNAQTQLDAKAATTYVDDAVAGLRTRIIAECASTANVTISSALEAGDAIDGVTLVAGDRVLLKNQSTASENGLYTAVGSGAGAASRDTQFNSISELSGQMVVVNQGSVNNDKIFLCTTNNTASLGSDSITFTTITPQNVGTVTSITAGTGLSGGAITSSGTIAINSTVATLDGTQTLTNKTLTSPKINEDVAVTSTATELNLLDGKAATNLALVGKQEGTNFTDSLLVGHATTGTLNDAQSNTGVGINALDALTSGDSNTAIGKDAGTAITTGLTNTILGSTAGLSITTGSANTAVGQFALPAAVSGSSNTAIGLFSGKIATGNWNVLVGKNAGKTISSGSGNVMIGGEAQVSSATGNRQLTIQGHDGSTTTTWISGSSAGVVTLNAANVTQQALTSSSNAVAWDASAKPNAVHITTENTTFSAPTNNVEGAFICIEINYNGSHTIAFNTIFNFAADTAPTFTSTDAKTDILVFRYNGAVYQEVGRTLNISEA